MDPVTIALTLIGFLTSRPKQEPPPAQVVHYVEDPPQCIAPIVVEPDPPPPPITEADMGPNYSVFTALEMIRAEERKKHK